MKLQGEDLIAWRAYMAAAIQGRSSIWQPGYLADQISQECSGLADAALAEEQKRREPKKQPLGPPSKVLEIVGEKKLPEGVDSW